MARKNLFATLCLLFIFFSTACETVHWLGGAQSSQVDRCPDDPDKIEPGICGCGVPEGACDGTDPTSDDTDTNTNTATDTNTITVIDTDTDTGTGQSDPLTFPIRGAFYYLGYPENWTVEASPVRYHPTLGYYNSDDTDAIDQHIEDMEYAKIDVAIAVWFGSDQEDQATRVPLLLDQTIAMGSHLKWAFGLKRVGLAGATVDEIKSKLDYLMSTYADHEAIARINGKPVIFVRNSGDNNTCEVASRWSQANQGQWYVSLKVFDGYEICVDQPDAWHQYGADAPVQAFPGSYAISPGFWSAFQASPVLARDIDRWYQNVADMVASDEPWQLITSFNDWGDEGSAVESATEWESASGYGQYLDALHSDGVK